MRKYSRYKLQKVIRRASVEFLVACNDLVTMYYPILIVVVGALTGGYLWSVKYQWIKDIVEIRV